MKTVVHFKFLSKRNIKKNILTSLKGLHLKKPGILFLLGMILLTSSGGLSSCSQQKDLSQRRIEKERARKDKEARKKYEQAIRQHEKNQSAATRSMMKETKKESPKNTPLKKSSGKKCK
jgi:ATPase subunit of ABC transporter with duplicated ATPase domains